MNKPKLGYRLEKSFFQKYEEIPESWKMEKVGKILKLNMGQSPPSNTYNEDKNGLPFYQGVTDFGHIYPKPTVWCSEPKKIGKKNEILFSVRAPVGETNLNNIDCCIGRGVASLNPQDNDLKYCYYLVKNNEKRFLAFSQGTTYDAINKSDLSDTKLPFTKSNKEQKKIGSILFNIDSLIQLIFELTKKIKKFKVDVTHQLLTKGIDNKKFKTIKWYFDKKIQIPENWKYEALGKSIKIISGDYFPFSDFVEKGIPVLKIDNVMYEKTDWTNTTYLPSSFTEKDVTLLQNGDIVLALNRPITNNQVKVARLTNNDIPSILYQRVGKFEFKKDAELDKDYFYYFLTSPFFKQLISRIMIGSDQPYIKTTELLEEKFPFPKKPEEQKKIAAILSNIDSKLSKLGAKNDMLESLKKGLMQKLLTGQIRVKT